VYSESLKAFAYKTYLERFNIENGDEWYYRHLGPTALELSGLLKEEFSLKSSAYKIRDGLESVYSMLLSRHFPRTIQDTVEFLDSLDNQDYKIGLASSDCRENIRVNLIRIGVYDKFDAIVSGKEVVYNKPAPDIYLLAAKRLRVNSQSCLVLEDSTAGIKAAKSAGMYCVAHKRHHNRYLELSGADLVVESFSELDLKDIEKRMGVVV
jgi:beta-phosphoglucomutase-like phosphatase (HAD superfamily)